MDTLNLPTKRNLLQAKAHLALARKGYELLDKKRQVLINELSIIKNNGIQAHKDLRNALSKADESLRVARLEISQKEMFNIYNYIPKNATLSINFRSIMGAELPLASSENSEAIIHYDLHNTTISLDEAACAWACAMEFIISWTTIENTLLRLNTQIKKTQKRANALGNITIPKYMARIKYIEERLEERERDELSRLKLLKSKFQNQSHP